MSGDDRDSEVYRWCWHFAYGSVTENQFLGWLTDFLRRSPDSPSKQVWQECLRRGFTSELLKDTAKNVVDQVARQYPQ